MYEDARDLADDLTSRPTMRPHILWWPSARSLVRSVRAPDAMHVVPFMARGASALVVFLRTLRKSADDRTWQEHALRTAGNHGFNLCNTHLRVLDPLGTLLWFIELRRLGCGIVIDEASDRQLGQLQTIVCDLSVVLEWYMAGEMTPDDTATVLRGVYRGLRGPAECDL